MLSSTNTPWISLSIPGHGSYEASALDVDVAIQRYLPSSVEQLRAIVQERSGLEIGFTDVHDVSALIVVLADFVRGERELVEWLNDNPDNPSTRSTTSAPSALRAWAEAEGQVLDDVDYSSTLPHEGSTSLRMNLAALHVLRDEGWDLSPNAGGSFAVEQLDDDTALVTIHTTKCQSVDLVDAARHCLRLAKVDDSIVVVSHDGSVVEPLQHALRPMTFTTRAFERSHGRKPSRTSIGTWAFQQARGEYAFEAEMIGEPWFAPGLLTLAQAKRAARQHFAANSIVAVLP